MFLKKTKLFFKDKGFIVLLLIFLASIPFVNPWLRGDGVGHYAYIRSIVIDGDLHFANEFYHGNEKFKLSWDETARTRTNYVPNIYGVGSSILWSPFFLLGHLYAFIFDFPMDGFSAPYLYLTAFGTLFYSFIGLLICYNLTKYFFSWKIGLISTITVWFASSLPVYMYFLPFRYHALTVFTVSLFLYIWWKTRENRKLFEWVLLGLLASLMVMVRITDAVFIVIILFEIADKIIGKKINQKLILMNIVFFLSFIIGLLPHFIIRHIINGNFLSHGYETEFAVSSFSVIKMFKVLFASAHGLFSWTPVLFFAFIGFFIFVKKDRIFSLSLLLAFFVMLYMISSWRFWGGSASFGNRFFCEFTLMFILGLSALIDYISKRISLKIISVIGCVFIIWNFLFIYQYGIGLIPREDYISWRKMAYNQIFVVPRHIFGTAKQYLNNRSLLLNQLEQDAVNKYRSREDREKISRETE